MYSDEELNQMHKEYWDLVTPEELQALEEATQKACEWFDAVMTTMRLSTKIITDSLQETDEVIIAPNC